MIHLYDKVFILQYCTCSLLIKQDSTQKKSTLVSAEHLPVVFLLIHMPQPIVDGCSFLGVDASWLKFCHVIYLVL